MSTNAWAISVGEPHVESYIGYRWFNGKYPDGENADSLRQRRAWFFSGMTTAVFKTRREARLALAIVNPKGGYRAFPNARVVKVAITIREVSA